MWAFAQTKPKALVLVARNAKALEGVAAEIRSVDPDIKTLIVPTDVTDETSVNALFEKVQGEFGGADVLINNSGASSPPAPLRDADPKSWWKDFVRFGAENSCLCTETLTQEVNVLGTFLISRGFLRLVGTEKQATIVTVASHSSFMDIPGYSSYIHSKLLTFQLSHHLAFENTNITSIAMHPGVLVTPMLDETSFFVPYAGDSITLAGATVVYLATKQAQWLTGRYVLANWDVEELKAREEEILKNNDLVVGLKGNLGAEHWS